MDDADREKRIEEDNEDKEIFNPDSGQAVICLRSMWLMKKYLLSSISAFKPPQLETNFGYLLRVNLNRLLLLTPYFFENLKLI